MRCSALLAVALAFLVSGTSRAQQPSNPPTGTTAPAAQTPAEMTPRQAAEIRADVLMARKDFDAAISAYKQILKDEPKNAVLLNKVGVAYEQLGDLKNSGNFYKKSMKADKNYASPINNLGTVEYAKKHYSKAVNLYKKALLLRTDMAIIYSNLGYAYFANKEYPEALDSFGNALTLDPNIFEHRGGAGALVQQKSSTDPGFLYFLVAKSFAMAGDAEHAAHYLKLSRDNGYKNFLSAEKDPAFARVVKDPRVQEVLKGAPPYTGEPKKPSSE